MIVLKFGSSVLRSERDLPAAVHEVYRHVRAGRRVVAVVSALGGATDALLAEARGFGDSPAEDALAAHLATGEARAVSVLALALGRAGVRCAPVDAARIGLRTRGPALAADPVEVDVGAIERLFERAPVLVAPGFVGTGEDGEATLLGRGGSDLTAVFLAHRLGARCRLIKDVDGVYTADPNEPDSGARRFDSLTWDEALRVGGRIVQPRALELARQWGVEVEVARAGGGARTVIGAGPRALAREVAQARLAAEYIAASDAVGSSSGPPICGDSDGPRAPALLRRGVPRRAVAPGIPLRVGLLGLGVVGRGVYEHLRALPELFQIVRIAVRDPGKHRDGGAGAPPELLTTDPWEVLDERPDVLVELIGGTRPAAALVEAALAEGRTVVTANKEVVSRHGPRLRELCEAHGGELLYSAAVGGGAPVIEAVRRARAEGEVVRVRAAVSGTCNFILDRAREGVDLPGAIRDAQRRGLAEAEPAMDISGQDLAHKIAILAWEAFGTELDPEEIPATGIGGLVRERGAAGEPGRVARLVGTCERDARGRVTARVEPVWLEAADPLAASRGEEVVCETQTGEGAGAGGADGGSSSSVVRGLGAGRWPTAESVLADLLELARRGGTHPAAARRLAPFAEADLREQHARAEDRVGMPPGVVQEVS